MFIKVAGVSKSYGSQAVLTDLSLTIRGERVTALVGPSGSGKSTLLTILGGTAMPDRGDVTVVIDGERSAPYEELAVWVPQGSNALANRTALDNAAIGALAGGHTLQSAHTLARTALDLVGLSHIAQRLARHLSGGELQRVSFARAICSERPLILADEPTANLDENNTLQVAKILDDLRRRATIIVATHDPILMSAADDVVDMRQRVTT